jgi:hypothetical protein
MAQDIATRFPTEPAMRPTHAIHLFAASTALVVVAACTKQAPTPTAPAAMASVAAASPTSVEKPAEAASVEPLAWMQGSWCGKDQDQLIEETWMLPQADEAIGMSRTVQSGRQVTFEFMRIAKIEGKDTLFAQPNGEPPTMFARTDGGADWIRFENPKHDYPTRIEYRRTKTGLHAEIGGPGAENKEEVISYDYLPCGR